MHDRYVWSVLYSDGTTVFEVVGPDEVNDFEDVDRERVVRLTVSPNGWHGDHGPTYVIECDPDAGIIPMFKRVEQEDEETGTTRRWHVFGTERIGEARTLRTFIHVSNNDDPDDPHAGVIISPYPVM